MMLLPTSLVGSYPQPDWLIDRQALLQRRVPRIHQPGLWRIPAPWLEQAQDDATEVALRDQERAGLDILTDGEIRRESYSARFATALAGLDLEHPGTVLSRTGQPTLVPRVVGPLRRTGPVEVRDLQFLRTRTGRPVKITLPGPFTLSQQALDEHYRDPRALALAYADAVREEVHDLFAAGADIVQLDEPYLQAQPDLARAFGVEALNRALAGAGGTTCVHLCFGYAAMVRERPAGYSFLPELAHADCAQISIETAQANLDCSVLEALPGKTILVGALNLADPAVETAEQVAARIRRAMRHVPPERIVVAPDCGMKYLSREVAFGKLCALVAGARLVRRELGAE
jgi:5-methyltetrahydropteroyltriglutamate--homocysteine methyltransferase